MDMGARSLVRQMRRAVASGSVATIFLVASANVLAQMGPVQHDGFLEYQYRLNRYEDGPGTDGHLATWRAHGSTWVWRPYILQLDGNIGLTRSTDSSDALQQNSTFITGSIYANAFQRSHFPFRAYYEARDTRVEGGLFDRDNVTNTWGFLQQYSARRGGRISVDFRNVDTEELFVDGIRAPRNFSSSTWQVNGSKSLGRNEFRLLSAFRNIEREELMQFEDRNTISLRHRFRTSPRFFVEDTTFFSDEQIALDGRDTVRRFLQFNGMSTWRPKTRRSLLVIGRAIARGTDSGPVGLEKSSSNAVLTGSVNYQLTPRVTIAGNAGATVSDTEEMPDESTVYQRLRGTYRSDAIGLGSMQYSWDGSVEVGNRRERNGGDDTTQDIGGTIGHGLSQSMAWPSGRQLQVSFSQQLAALADTQDRRAQSLVNSVFLTLSRQNGRVSNYARLSASDRRAFGDKEDSFQLVTLQLSTRMQVNRRRSLNGGLTLQYNTNSMKLLNSDEQENSSSTYSANLTYIERDLFKVPRLNFLSELRLLSSDFRSNDILDQGIETDPDRDDKSWRNRLDYRVGKLELQLLADVREINNSWMSQVLFTVRRYYGAM